MARITFWGTPEKAGVLELSTIAIAISALILTIYKIL